MKRATQNFHSNDDSNENDNDKFMTLRFKSNFYTDHPLYFGCFFAIFRILTVNKRTLYYYHHKRNDFPIIFVFFSSFIRKINKMKLCRCVCIGEKFV